MTKEELKKEAEKWLCNNLHSASEEDFIKAMVEFAEPREKRIAELEDKLEQTENDLADYQFNYPTIKELQKENARLKEINTHILSQLNLDNGELITQLTKAKEYIKLLLMNCVSVYESTGKTIAEIQVEAEQFLKDCKVEK
jgi:hypothetical protein